MQLREEFAQQISQSKCLVKFGKDSACYVPISHHEIDGLIGRLMQICDIMGDSTQRDAVKAEIKQRTRSWLDDGYYTLGYRDARTKEDAEERDKNVAIVIPPFLANK